MVEWFQNLCQFLPEAAQVILIGLGVFVTLEIIVKVVTHISYLRSDNYVRDQWRQSKHWDEYRALEYQRVWPENSNLPTLARLRELEALDKQTADTTQHPG